MKKNPEQTEQTRQNLKDAYWRLLRGGQRRTVDAICALAGYNRCTFYRYYESADALLKEIEEDLCAQIHALAQAALAEHDDARFLREIAALYEARGDEICTLLGERGDPAFMARMRAELAPVLLGFFHLEAHPCRELIVTFLSAALSQTLSEWYRAGRPIPEEELAALLAGLLYHGLAAVETGGGDRPTFWPSRP